MRVLCSRRADRRTSVTISDCSYVRFDAAHTRVLTLEEGSVNTYTLSECITINDYAVFLYDSYLHNPTRVDISLFAPLNSILIHSASCCSSSRMLSHCILIRSASSCCCSHALRTYTYTYALVSHALCILIHYFFFLYCYTTPCYYLYTYTVTRMWGCSCILIQYVARFDSECAQSREVSGYPERKEHPLAGVYVASDSIVIQCSTL